MLFDLRRPLGAGLLADKPRPAPARLTIGRGGARGRGCPCVVIQTRAPGPGAGYVLSALVSTRAFERLLPPNDEQYPVSAIVDGEGRFVARSLNQAERVGRPGSVSFAPGGRRAARRSASIAERRSKGCENYTAFARSTLSGWSAHVALGARYIDDPTRALPELARRCRPAVDRAGGGADLVRASPDGRGPQDRRTRPAAAEARSARPADRRDRA